MHGSLKERRAKKRARYNLKQRKRTMLAEDPYAEKRSEHSQAPAGHSTTHVR